MWVCFFIFHNEFIKVFSMVLQTGKEGSKKRHKGDIYVRQLFLK